MDRLKTDLVNKLLEKLASQFGIDSLSLSRNGRCTIKIDEKFEVFMETSKNSDQLRLYGVVTSLEFVSNNNLHSKLLAENLTGNIDGGNYFAASIERSKLLLVSGIDMEKLDFSYFVKRLESFINYLDTCIEDINSKNSRFSTDASDVINSMQNTALPEKPMLMSNTSMQSKLFDQLSK